MKKHQVFSLGIFTAAVLLTSLSVFTIARAAANPPVIGDWQGALDTGGGSLRLVVHIAQDKSSNLTATLDSPDQGTTGIEVSSITFKSPDLHFEVTRIGGSYDGKINSDGTEIAGNWKQGAASLSLNLKRAGK